MDDSQLDIYYREIKRQANIAEYLVGLHQEAARSGRITEVFATAQGILAAAVAVSRTLWPDPPIRRKGMNPVAYAELEKFTNDRGEQLRHALVADDFAFLKERKVRNSLEHFDARLDEHLLARQPIIDSNIGMPEFIQTPYNVLRLFDDVRLELSVLGEKVSIPQLCRAMNELANRIFTLETVHAESYDAAAAQAEVADPSPVATGD
ncbi:hypothetical protein [Pseudarthrobacter sp. CCNWLW207]|uniref:hypothetical protein n=1 Tax=Pseudarthrobacter sp. CCNWLW207 TaxID=3127468 RepID=UPI003076FD4A